jgi:hypothetical protein
MQNRETISSNIYKAIQSYEDFIPFDEALRLLMPKPQVDKVEVREKRFRDFEKWYLSGFPENAGLTDAELMIKAGERIASWRAQGIKGGLFFSELSRQFLDWWDTQVSTKRSTAREARNTQKSARRRKKRLVG